MKVWTAIIALVTVFAARYGFEISEQMTALVATIFAVLLAGQGAADFGKNKTNDSAVAAAVAPTAEKDKAA
jgi:hypothetical protein